MRLLTCGLVVVALGGCSLIREAKAIAAVTVPGRHYRAYSIPSEAMTPTLTVGSRAYVDLDAYASSSPQRGDIAVFTPPEVVDEPFIKRIVAGPGDRFRMVGGVMYVNGKKTAEPYIKEPANYNLEIRDYGIYEQFAGMRGWQRLDAGQANLPPKSRWPSADTVPPDCYVLLGDNRNDSEDSHVWGFAQLRGAFASGIMAGKPAGFVGKVVLILPKG